MKKLFIFLLIFFPVIFKAETKAPVDLTTMNIYEIQAAVDDGLIDYETIMNIYIERINAYNKQYNAVLTINEEALNQARQLQTEYETSGRRSLIHGLPILVKDNIDVASMPTTAGTKALKNNYPLKNAPIVQKLIDAGAIVIGKTNMSEFAFSAHNSYSSYGHVYNAYNTLYSSYGSSGGSAVGTAANFAVASLGTDTGSSIRIPSSANNLVGLRPTYGSIDMNGIIKFEATRDVAGPITRFVEDNAIILEIIDDSDSSYQISEKKSLEGIRIGVVKSFNNPSSNTTYTATGKTDRTVYDLFVKAIEDLKGLGAEIVYINSFNLPYYWDSTTMCYDFNTYIKGTTGPIKNYNDLIKNGGYVKGLASYLGYYCNNDYTKTSTYKNYLAKRNNNIKRANKVYSNNNLDVVIYPTLKTELIKISKLSSTKLYTPSSSLSPLIGFPSINVQMGYINSLPYGFEILGKPSTENLLYQIAYSYQEINNYYANPSIAAPLYEIPEKLNNILEYLKMESSEPEYLDIKKKAKLLIDNYNEIDDVDKAIDEIIIEYKNAPNLIKVRKQLEEETANKQRQTETLIGLIGIIMIILAITIVFIKKRTKNIKPDKYKEVPISKIVKKKSVKKRKTKVSKRKKVKGKKKQKTNINKKKKVNKS